MSLVGVRPALVQIDPVPRISIQAFCESTEASAVVAEAAADRRMAKAQVKQNMGGAAAALEAYRNAATPNVIVLEAPADREALVAQLDELAHCCDAGTKVVVLGRTNDIVALSPADGAGGQRISRAAVRRRRLRAGDLAALPRAGRKTARPDRQRDRVEGRRRRFDRRAQSRLVAGLDLRQGDHHRRFRPRLRHGRARLQPGPAPGRGRRGVRARTRRRHAGRPAARQMRRQSQPARRARDARSRARLFRRPLSTR